MFTEKGGGRTGTFTVGNESLPFVLQDLPTIVESFKTYDDINLVKTTDIGQVFADWA
jgi:transcription initiation factor TFIID subunit 7